MIGGIIPDDHRVLAPMLVFGVKHLHQLSQVDLHDLCVRVGLKQADKDPTEFVNASDERDPRVDGDLLLPRSPSFWLPAAPLIPDGVEPALVDIDQAALTLE